MSFCFLFAQLFLRRRGEGKEARDEWRREGREEEGGREGRREAREEGREGTNEEQPSFVNS